MDPKLRLEHNASDSGSDVPSHLYSKHNHRISIDAPKLECGGFLLTIRYCKDLSEIISAAGDDILSIRTPGNVVNLLSSHAVNRIIVVISFLSLVLSHCGRSSHCGYTRYI